MCLKRRRILGYIQGKIAASFVSRFLFFFFFSLVKKMINGKLGLPQ